MKNVRILAIVFILIITTIFTGYFRFVHRIDIIFAHFFYIPIIIAAFWWQFNVIYVILYAIAALLVSDFYINNTNFMIHDIVRSAFFTFVGLGTAYLIRERAKLSCQIKYKYIMSSMREPVVIVDRNYNIILSNDKFSEVFPLTGKNVCLFKNIMNDDLFLSKFRDSIDICFRNEDITFSSYVTTRDSSPGFYEINFYPLIENNYVEDVVITFRDMTEFKNSIIRQNIASERQKVAINVLELLNRENPDADVIKEILNLVRESTGVEVLGMMLKVDGSFKLYGISGAGGNYAEYINSNCPLITGTGGGSSYDCLCARSIDSLRSAGAETRECDGALWNNNIHESCNRDGDPLCIFAGFGSYNSCATIPLVDKDGVAGFFIIFDSNRNFFNDEIIDFYRGIVQSVGIALSRIKYESSLKKIIADKELLIREVHHRVKNNMQVITSLISLQTAKQTDDYVRRILTDCQNRVRTMALVHEKMYSSNNFSSINFQSYIQSLVPILQSSYRIDRNKVKVEIDVSDATLSLGVAIPLAQLINEILSNSFKHAFTDGRGGFVKIGIQPEGDDAKSYCLSMSDSGTGFAPGIAFPATGNLGFQLIDALIKQLRGRYTLNSSDGISYQIYFSDAV